MGAFCQCLFESTHHFTFNSPSLQALVQELNFCAYLGLPAFMIPLRGAQCANLARVLLNHLHTGHHSSMVNMQLFSIKIIVL